MNRFMTGYKRPLISESVKARKAAEETVDESTEETVDESTEETVDEAAKFITKKEQGMLKKVEKALNKATSGVAPNNFAVDLQPKVKKAFDAIEKAEAAVAALADLKVSG